MNAKIKKVIKEIDNTEQKIAEFQERLKQLNQEKVDLENLEIIGMVRGMKVTTYDIENVMKSFTDFYKNGASLKQEDKKKMEDIIDED
ncbi:DUF4315 family protein [Tannockella kyphosi]|uniref:DUF4315 family protein n=1 Tax=Tannockella kyphosi TaxID=2899121 RepID=UPI002011C7F9|nr:DUF4315 family protein [Tannockella kyphosi]